MINQKIELDFEITLRKNKRKIKLSNWNVTQTNIVIYLLIYA